MHPIIKEFLNGTTTLDEVIEKHHQKDDSFENLFIEVVKASLFKIKADSSIYKKIDEAIVKGHADQNIYMLFILNCISFLITQQQSEKVYTLHTIASSIFQENLNPVIRALYLQTTAFLILHEKKRIEYKKVMKEALGLVDQKHPKYKILLENYAGMLAFEGQLNDLDEKEKVIFNTPASDIKEYFKSDAKLLNCASTGNFENGFRFINEFQHYYQGEKKVRIKEFSFLFNILSGDLIESHFEDRAFKSIVQVFYSLSIGKIEDAIKYHKLFLNNIDSHPLADKLYEYVPLNLELCLGNKREARRLLEEKETMGSFHYLDDLFFSRVFLLEGNINGAYQSMARLLKNANHYEAMNRVLFELQLAMEIKPTDLFKMMNKFNNADAITEIKIKKVIPVEIKLAGIKHLIGSSFKINQVKEQVNKYATIKEIVLVTGETGTGKELVARALHEESPFYKEPFLAINCGALTDTLLESELFGYEAGSFTGALKQKKGIFEAAGKGTVFLDEFGDISPKLQVSLLRVLESNEIRMIGGSNTRKIECRIVVATNIELKNAVEDKRFREDLYFRLARLEILIPPLRERVIDIPELVNYFLLGSISSTGKQKIVSKEAINIFSLYPWPGNIRELKNCIDRLKILNPEKDIFDVEDLSFMKFQGIVSLPKNQEKLEPANKSKSESTESIKEDSLSNDPILNLIIQRGLKSEQRILHLKKLFEKYKLLSRCQIMEITKINPITASKDLQKLCEQGFIIKRTPTKSRRSNYYEII